MGHDTNDDADMKEGVHAALFRLVKLGEVTVSVDPDTGEATYTLTEKGRAHARQDRRSWRDLAENGPDLDGRD